MLCDASPSPTILTQITGITDSGADISIANYATVNDLNIPIFDLEQPIHITFANGTTSTTHHYAELGPLGSIHLVSDADSTLISVNEIIKQGYNILYTNDAIHILDNLGTTLFSQPRQPHQTRWAIDIKSAMQQIQQSTQQHTDNTTSSAIVQSIKRQKRISEKVVQLVFNLHQYWSHTDSEIMAKAFTPHNPFLSTSPFAALSADIIRTVFDHRSCVACMIGKLNRMPRQLGSGVSPRTGECWSMDVIGPFPVPTLHGARMYIQFVELRTGYVKTFLVKENTAFSNILAITDVINFNKINHHQLKTIRFDAGSVNLSHELTQFLIQHDIQPAPAAPEQQQQNPTERYRQIIRKRMATNQIDQLLLT